MGTQKWDSIWPLNEDAARLSCSSPRCFTKSVRHSSRPSFSRGRGAGSELQHWAASRARSWPLSSGHAQALLCFEQRRVEVSSSAWIVSSSSQRHQPDVQHIWNIQKRRNRAAVAWVPYVAAYGEGGTKWKVRQHSAMLIDLQEEIIKMVLDNREIKKPFLRADLRVAPCSNPLL